MKVLRLGFYCAAFAISGLSSAVEKMDYDGAGGFSSGAGTLDDKMMDSAIKGAFKGATKGGVKTGIKAAAKIGSGPAGVVLDSISPAETGGIDTITEEHRAEMRELNRQAEIDRQERQEKEKKEKKEKKESGLKTEVEQEQDDCSKKNKTDCGDEAEVTNGTAMVENKEHEVNDEKPITPDLIGHDDCRITTSAECGNAPDGEPAEQQKPITPDLIGHDDCRITTSAECGNAPDGEPAEQQKPITPDLIGHDDCRITTSAECGNAPDGEVIDQQPTIIVIDHNCGLISTPECGRTLDPFDIFTEDSFPNIKTDPISGGGFPALGE